MRRDVEDEQTIRRYLLDDLPPEERRRLEERLLDDGDEFIDQLQLAEAELADDYVTGELSDTESARFREGLAFSPERGEQLRFAELLREHFAGAPPLKKTVTGEVRTPASSLERLTQILRLDRPAVGFALACGLILAVGVAAWLGLRAWQLSARLDRLQAQQSLPPADTEALARLRQQLEEERARRESAAQELAREQERRVGLEQEVVRLKEGVQGEMAGASPMPSHTTERPTRRETRGPSGTVLALTLTSGLVRESGGTNTLRLTPSTTTVRLRLDVGADDYMNYRAILGNADGETLLSIPALRPRAVRSGRVVVFDVPANLLKGGDYQVKLAGVTRSRSIEDVGTYYFRVARD